MKRQELLKIVEGAAIGVGAVAMVLGLLVDFDVYMRGVAGVTFGMVLGLYRRQP